MAAPATIDEFLDLIRKSGVSDDKRLEAYVDKARASGSLPKEPTKFAGMLIRDGYLTQFQAEHILRGKWKRFSIGKYRVLERLGSGGMGAVYLCEHKLMRRRVAVKVLPAAKAKDESALKRFEREARAAAALDHPNIVHAYDIDQDEDLHFLVMEYVDGASLQEIIKKSGPMDPLRAAHYIRQAALGLEHAHGAGLVHRDIKPGNILVDRAGVVKILDMGLARFFHDEDDNLTRKFDENVLGTADYLAPEQAVDSHEVDIRADIYSLGATFYYCLTGKPPFGEGTVAQKLIWHQTKQPKPLLQIRSDIPERLVAVIEKMMSKDAAQRYQRPVEIFDAVGALTETPISPPKTAEMPALSLAARSGPVEHEQSTIVSQHAPSSPLSPAPRPAAAALRGPASSRTSLKEAVVNQKATMPPPPPPRRDARERDETWAVDTEIPIALADTERGGDSTHRRATQKEEERRRKSFLTILGVVSAISIVGLIIAIVVYFQVNTPVKVERVPLLRVSRDPKLAGENTFATLQLALNNARERDTIEIWDKTLEENVFVDPKKVHTTQVIVKAAPGVEVVWKSKDKSGKRPLLHLGNAKDFRLKANGIELNGEISPGVVVEDLVRMSFKCRGLLIEDLRVRSFSRSALAISNCAGEAGEPVRIVHLQSNVDPKKRPESIIRFSSSPDAQPRINDYIEFDNTCQFLNMPFKDVVKIEDSKTMGPGIRLPIDPKLTAQPPATKTPNPPAKTPTTPAKK